MTTLLELIAFVCGLMLYVVWIEMWYDMAREGRPSQLVCMFCGVFVPAYLTGLVASLVWG